MAVMENLGRHLPWIWVPGAQAGERAYGLALCRERLASEQVSDPRSSALTAGRAVCLMTGGVGGSSHTVWSAPGANDPQEGAGRWPGQVPCKPQHPAMQSSPPPPQSCLIRL